MEVLSVRKRRKKRSGKDYRLRENSSAGGLAENTSGVSGNSEYSGSGDDALSLWVLRNLPDRVAGTNIWINGNGETVTALEKEGWDFKSEEAAKTMARSALKGSAEFVQDLLKEGVRGSVEDESGNSTLAAAAQAGDH